MNFWGTFWRKRDREQDLDAELRFHLEEQVRANLAAGMEPAEARRSAALEFGGVEQVKEACRDTRPGIWFDRFGKDVRYSLRSLRRSPGFFLTVLVTLALGIGIATAVFDLETNSSLFAVPYPHPEQLYLIGFSDKQSPSNEWREGRYWRLYSEQTRSFTAFAGATFDASNVVVDGDPGFVEVRRTTKEFFSTLGIRPMLGRTFVPEEFLPGSDNVIIVSDLFWRTRLKGVANPLGQTVRIDEKVCTVVGVLPVMQPLPRALEGAIFRPYAPVDDPADVFKGSMTIVGRLRPGVSPEEATQELAAVKEQPAVPEWAQRYLAEQRPLLIPIRQLDHPDSGWVLVASAALLFAIACTNSVNLFLLRILGRRRELSIRVAVGASRRSILRLLALESVVVCTAAFGLVVIAAIFAFPTIFATLSQNDDARFGTYHTGHSLACMAVLSAAAALTILTASALSLLRTRHASLRDIGAHAGEGRRMNLLRYSLVALQTALAVILLFGTGLMLKTFYRLHQVDLGFDPAGKVNVRIAFPAAYMPSRDARLQLFERLRQRLRPLPGVKDVAAGQDALLIGFFAGTAELQMADGSFQPVAGNFVSAGYQAAAGLRLKRGRWLAGKDWSNEAVINESMARARFGTTDPIGQTFRIRANLKDTLTVVGVIQDVRQSARAADGMRFYVPDRFYPANLNSLVIRLDQEPRPGFADLVKRAVYAVDPRLITTVDSIRELIDQPLAPEIFTYRILRYLTAIGFGLAVVGIFTIVAYSVDCRMKEFGIRRAVGADSFSLRKLVLRRGASPAVAGLVVGVGAGLALTRFMKSLLFETSPNDPLVCAAVVVVLLLAALAACWPPASRAAAVDVTTLLKTD